MRHDFDPDLAAFDRHPAFRIKRTHSRARPIRLPPRRIANVWPLPSIAGVSPTLTVKDGGVLLQYDARAGQLPAFVPVFAVRDGVVVYAGSALDTHAITIDHGDHHRSYYSGLAHSFVSWAACDRREQRIRVGDLLGYARPSDPNAGALHFTVMTYDDKDRFQCVDLVTAMQSWRILPWVEQPITPNAHRLAA